MHPDRRRGAGVARERARRGVDGAGTKMDRVGGRGRAWAAAKAGLRGGRRALSLQCLVNTTQQAQG